MLKKISSYTFALLGMVLLLSSCKKEYESIQNIDDTKIEDYLTKNNIDAIPDEDKTGYYYVINNPSSNDATYLNSDSVRYNISIKSMLSGSVYTSSPEISNLGTYVGYTGSVVGLTIPAVRNVLLKLKPGGTARIFLPSYLAFGKNGNTSLNVPSNDPIELVLTTYSKKQYELDDEHIQAFLTKNALTATKDVSGVYYIVTQEGTGTDPIGINTNLNLAYTGRTLDGVVFDSSTSLLISVKRLIQGWEVLQKFTKGAKVRIFIPSVLGYGNVAQSSFGANSSLDFDVEIIDATD